jgi:hypothetical protein
MDAASGVLRRCVRVEPADLSAVALGQSRDDFISDTIRQTGEIVFAQIERDGRHDGVSTTDASS